MTSTNENSPFRLRRVERLRDEEVVSGFCAPPGVHLTDRRNIIIQGPRGSGKSTLLRALTASPAPGYALRTEDGELVVGCYVTLSFQWLASFQRHFFSAPKLNDDQRTLILTQALNLYLFRNLCDTVERLILTQGETEATRIKMTVEAARVLLPQIVKGFQPTARDDLARVVAEVEALQLDLTDQTLRGVLTGDLTMPDRLRLAEFFTPLANSVRGLEVVFNLHHKAIWVFAFDELDHLDHFGIRLFNTLMASAQYPISIKGACLPHGHLSRETLSHENTVDIGQDFDYIALALDPKNEDTQRFCTELYERRVGLMGSPIPADPEEWLRAPSLIERATPSLSRVLDTDDWEKAVHEATQSGGSETSLPPSTRRKLAPSLAMRVLRKDGRGNRRLPVYCGWDSVVAAADANPRRLFRLLDRLYGEWYALGQGTPVPSEVQSQVISTVAENAYDKLIALPFKGRAVRDIVEAVGIALRDRLHDSPTVPRDSCSVSFNLDDLDTPLRDTLQTALNYGVFCPWEFDPLNGYPTGLHNYWLSFGLAPKFWLVLRRGNVRALQRLLSLKEATTDEEARQMSILSASRTPNNTDGNTP